METHDDQRADTPAGGDLPVPAKFRDPQTGEIRVRALLKSYLELERKMARMIEVPGPDADSDAQAHFRRALGVPERAEDYPIRPPHEMIQPDGEVNQRLLEAGFTPAQAQLVYDLAAERMLPAIETMTAEFEAEQQLDRLVEHFGGEEAWREVAGQLATWGRKTLPPEVFQALSTTAEGVLAMHRMMAAGEPGLVKDATPAASPSEEELRRLMADPRYWRDRDPAVTRQVSDGFRRLYPGTVST